MRMANTAGALNLPIVMSPMPESFWPRLDGFSCRLFVVTAMFCIFAAIFMMPLLPRDLSGQMAMIK